MEMTYKDQLAEYLQELFSASLLSDIIDFNEDIKLIQTLLDDMAKDNQLSDENLLSDILSDISELTEHYITDSI